ncbi:hypothetical protein B6U99_04940 [Candidatus Geothermarchaeota archaeon ex4572_27]|nr:MAG: hypothetical protein B6U99_04940 [Candidatus Geothermarchaeota archaeon ex4572_27]
MTTAIAIRAPSIGTVKAVIDPSESPVTASRIVESLPLRGTAKRWGDEVYFKVPLGLPPENARVEVEVGEVAYWPEGKCICIFFGRTPISPPEGPIRAYSPVNVFARVVGDPTVFRRVVEGEEVALELLSE